MAGELTKPTRFTPAQAGQIADPDIYNKNAAITTAGPSVFTDVDGAYADGDIGDESIAATGSLIADAKVRSGKSVKVYDENGLIISEVQWDDLAAQEDLTITKFSDLSSGVYITGNYYIATVTTGIFTENYIYLKITSGSGWSEIIPFEKQQVFLDSNKLPYYYNGTEWGQIAGSIPLQTIEVASGSPQRIVEIKDIPVDDYSSFKIKISGLRPELNQTSVRMRASVDNGVTYALTSYEHTMFGAVNGTAIVDTATSDTSADLSQSALFTSRVGTAAGGSFNSTVKIHNSQPDGLWRAYDVSSMYSDAVVPANLVTLKGSGFIKSLTTKINALQFFMNGGDINQCIIKLYGIK